MSVPLVTPDLPFVSPPQPPRHVLLPNPLTVRRRAHARHLELYREQVAEHMAGYDGLTVWSPADQQRARLYVEHAVATMAWPETRVGVADQARAEIYLLARYLGVVAAVVTSVLLWHGGAVVLYAPVLALACLAWLTLGQLADHVFLRGVRWRSIGVNAAVCVVAGGLLALALTHRTGLPLWLRTGAAAGLVAFLATAVPQLGANTGYVLFNVAAWRRKNAMSPGEELVTDFLVVLRDIAERRARLAQLEAMAEAVGSGALADDDHSRLLFEVGSDRFGCAFGMRMAFVLEYTAGVLEGPWSHRLGVQHPPVAAALAQHARATAAVLRSWKLQVLYNDERIDEMSTAFATGLLNLVDGRWLNMLPPPSDPLPAPEVPRKRRVTHVVKGAVLLLLPVVTAVVVLTLHVNPVLSGPVATLGVILPLVQVLSWLDPKAHEKFTATEGLLQSVAALRR
jgi:hypothetical protein